MRSLLRPFVLTFPIVLSVAAPAGAKTVEVSKDGPVASIAQALALVGPGDRIEVEPGTYAGSFDVPPGKDGLTLVGSGLVIVEGWELGNPDPTNSFGIRVLSDDVTIERLTLRNASYSDAGPSKPGLHGAGARLTLREVKVLHTPEGITLEGDGSVVDSCEVVGGGVRVAASDCRIEDTTIRNAPLGVRAASGSDSLRVKDCLILNIDGRAGLSTGHGIHVLGNDPTIVGNVVERVEREGIHTESSGGAVRKNVVRGAGGNGMFLGYAIDRVEKNVVEDVGGFGLMTWAYDEDDLVRDNEVRRARGTGMFVFGPGNGGTVRDNRIEAVASNDGFPAVGLSLDGTGLVVEGNDVRDVSGAGVATWPTSTNLLLAENLVLRCGQREDASFLLSGSGHVLDSNVARQGGGDGFLLADTIGLTLLSNRAVANGVDGFDVSPATQALTMIGNRAKKNGAEGLEHSGGAGCVYRDNVLVENRIDLAADGAPAIFEENAFASGGLATPPDVD